MVWVLVLLVVLAAVVIPFSSLDFLRDRWPTKPGLRTSILVIALGSGLALGEAIDFASERYSDHREPLVRADPFIEDVTYFAITLPDDWANRDLTLREVERWYQGIPTSWTMTLTPEEAERLNSIADNSGMVTQVRPGEIVDDQRLVRLTSHPLLYLSRYRRWASYGPKYSRAVSVSGSFAALEGPFAEILDTPGFMQGVVGMMATRRIDVPQMPDRCSQSDRLNSFRLQSQADSSGDTVVSIEHPQWRMVFDRSDDARRTEGAQYLGRVLLGDCRSELVNVLQQATAIYGRETELMRSYLESWDEALRNRSPQSLRLRVTFSNASTHDMFVRNIAKVRVGSDGTESIDLLIDAMNSDGDGMRQDSFTGLPSRSAETVVFVGRLDELNEDDASRLHAAYQSELAYIGATFVAYADRNEVELQAPAAIFSIRRRQAVENAVRALDVAHTP